mmetsp:Transcript_93083/g.267803  ORF Transcript_93083/g.267803 Transcript_93083/m.267803 type:complete len:338 (+) Transcript_93083:83-1096(+)
MPAKRAATPSKQSSKRAREEDPLAKCGDVAAMIKEARADFPTDVLKMLSNNVHNCLARRKDERHDFQSRMVEMMSQTLTSVEGRRASAVHELEKKVGAADGEQAARDALVDSAGEDVKARNEAADAARAAAKEASAAADDAAAALAASKAEQKEGDSAYNQAVQDKSRLEAIVAGEYENFKAHKPMMAPRKALQRIVALGPEFEFNTQLMEAAATTLPKSQRGTFDKLVISELDSLFASTIATLGERIAGDEAARTSRATQVEAATAAHEAAVAVAAERKAELDAANEAAKAAEAARKEAVRAARDFGPELKATKSSLAEAKAALEEVQQVLAAFKV